MGKNINQNEHCSSCMEVLFMKVKKDSLLLIASIVWFIAGFNILHIGLLSYIGHVSIFNILLSILVFIFFWFLVFRKLVLKHTMRILNYHETKQFFMNFFDLKSFFIMAFMITFGIIIRVFNLVPDIFIAVFYSGVGVALTGAGLYFGFNYLKTRQKNMDYKEENDNAGNHGNNI